MAACNTKPPTLLCTQRPAAEKYICYRPSVYTSGLGPNRRFNVQWSGCSEYNECDNIESMVGQKCYVKTTFFGDTEILKGPIHPNTMASVELMDLDMYKKEGLVYKVNPTEAIWGSSSGYSGDSELQIQLSKAIQDGSLDGYTDLSQPCRKNYAPGLFPEINDIEEPYEIARESEYSCGANPFRAGGVCVTSEVFTELCSSGLDNVAQYYHIDAVSGYDMLNGRPGREIYLKAKICDYNPAKKYEIQITYKDRSTNQVHKMGEAVRLGYDPNLTHIKKREPMGEPGSGSAVFFTVQVFISHPYIGTAATATMDVALKETTANQVLANGTITVRDRYGYNKKEYPKREFNVYIGKNPNAYSSDMGNYSFKSKTFINHFQKAFTQDAHVVGNFNQMNFPDYLIDRDGYAVLLVDDIESDTGSFILRYNEALRIWRRRCQQYFYLAKNGQANYLNLQQLIVNYRRLREYDNTALLVVIKTGRLYEYNGQSNSLTDVTKNLLDKNKFVFDTEYKKMLNDENGAIFGLTTGDLDPEFYNPVSMIFRDFIEKHHLLSLNGTVIKVGLHELVHSWNFRGSIGNGSSNCLNHLTYIYGDNMKHCMFKCPHDPKSLEKITFSSGIIQRMLNVMSVTF